MLGHPLEKIIGSHCYELMHGTKEPYTDCPLTKMLKSKKHEESELFLKEQNIWAFVTIDPILNEKGEIVRVIHNLRDISKRKLAEESMAKYQLLLTEAQRAAKLGGFDFDVKTKAQK